MKQNKCYTITVFLLIGGSLLFNLLACSSAFCDIYTIHIYRLLSDIWGRVFALFPFAMGVILMYLGALLIILTIIIALLLIILRKKHSYRRFAQGFLKSMLVTVLSVILIYTLHWVIPYRSSLLGAGNTYQMKNSASSASNSDTPSNRYTVRELGLLRSYIVENLNKCCLTVPRDEEGHVIYPSTDSMQAEVTRAMQGISDEFPRLTGYYPPMKTALCSDVLDWMGIGGYTYPYTMEITINQYVSDLYYPTLISHEAAHHQGYYQENEANFLSYLGCSRSDDPILRYSAYLYIYSYIDSDYFQALSESVTDLSELKNYGDDVLPQVWTDDWEAFMKSEEIYEADSHPLEEFSDTASDVAEVGWDTQAEIIQENGYDGVVELMLIYYDGILY